MTVSVMGICLLTAPGVGASEVGGHKAKKEPRIITDGHLRPGHLETIRATGFPGKGEIWVSFFPTAICEDGCAANSYSGGRTDARGGATFRVRVPGTFFSFHNRHVYFRDGERIAVNVTWEGPNDSFAVGYAEPEPTIVRTHGSRHG